MGCGSSNLIRERNQGDAQGFLEREFMLTEKNVV